MKKNAIRLLFYLLLVCSEARRIPRGLEYDLFPNFRAVYHGHGATSYQNVHIENHGSVPVPTDSKRIHTVEHLINYGDEEYHPHIAVLKTDEHEDEHYIVATAAPFYDDHLDHIATAIEVAPHHYQYYEHVNYEYD